MQKILSGFTVVKRNLLLQYAFDLESQILGTEYKAREHWTTSLACVNILS